MGSEEESLENETTLIGGTGKYIEVCRDEQRMRVMACSAHGSLALISMHGDS